MLTIKTLEASELYLLWVTARVVLTRNIYRDGNATFIVIQDLGNGKYSITRFFETVENMNVSLDHKELTSEEVFKVLTEEYSVGLS